VTTSVTTPAAGHAACPVCGTGLTRVRRQAYCTPTCRQAAWRARQPHPVDSAAATVVVPAGRSRRDVTVYACTECDQRGEPMTVDELLNTRDDQYLTSKIR